MGDRIDRGTTLLQNFHVFLYYQFKFEPVCFSSNKAPTTIMIHSSTLRTWVGPHKYSLNAG